MRKLSKKRFGLLIDKSGVILVTVIFIVGMALIFITTALMISIATRQRVYTNAKSDQARLTVTSLSQAIWQSIYSQQINDNMLCALAKAGTVVSYNCNDVPGLVSGTGEATAYFYAIESDAAGNPTKIGIECKCNIDGEVQYYTLVLTKNAGEGAPQPMFPMCVELGNPGMLNSFCFGVDASQIVFSNDKGWMKQQEYNAPAGDNIIFLRGDGTTSDRDGSGFYCKVLATGHIYLRNAVFTDDVYFVGQNSIFDFTSTSSTGELMADQTPGNLYFWGVNAPFATTEWGATTTMHTFNDITFDYRATDASAAAPLNPTSTGFNNAGGGTIDGTPYLRGYNNAHPWEIAGNVYYERGGSGSYLTGAPGTWQPFNNNTDRIPNISSYLTVDDSAIDTVSEVVAAYGKYADHSTATKIDSSTAGISHGYYYIESDTEITQTINCDVSGGDIIIYVIGNCELKNGGKFVISSGDSVEHNVIFVLENSKSISVHTSSASAATGFVDPRCFSGGLAGCLDVHNLKQTTIPRFYIFSAYTGGIALTLGATDTNGGVVCTAFLGFFPSSVRGNNGASLNLHNVAAGTDHGGSGIIYYGRIAAGSLPNGTDAGGHLMVPYCPSIPGQLNYRNEAYRDNTDFSVVTGECGYFTA